MTLFLARLFPALALFISWLSASHLLPIDVYGQYQRFWIQLSTLGSIAALGYPTFIFNYPGLAALEVLRAIPKRKVQAYITCILAAAVLFGVFQHPSNLALIGGLTFLAWTFGLLLEATLLALKERRSVIVLNILYAGGMVSTHLILLNGGATLSTLMGSVCLMIVIKAVGSLLLLSRYRSAFKGTSNPIRHIDYAKQWKHFAVNDTIQVLFRWIDKFILSFLLIQSTFAVYANASIDIPFLPVLFAAVAGAAVQHWASTGKEESPIPVLHHGTKLLSALIFPLFAFLMAFRIEVLHILFSSQYVSGVWIFVCAQLVLPLRAYPFTSLLQSHKRADIITRGAVIDFAIACVLMYPLYRLLHLPGIALAFVISTYWQAGYYLIKTQEVTNIPLLKLFPAKTLIVRLAVALVIFFGVYLILQFLPLTVLQLFIAGLVLLVGYATVALTLEWRKA